MIGLGNDCLLPLYVPIDGFHEKLRVRCGHCINCKIHRAQEWCMRLEMESNYWKDICFVTLTYNDDSLPLNIVDGHLFFSDEEMEEHEELQDIFVPTLRPSDLRNFLKRLRKRLEHKIRYYAVGEYGTGGTRRPHIHLMIFGLSGDLNTKRLIEQCWDYGFVDVRPFFTETCSYIAGYVQKKLYGRDRYLFKLPEFMRCSQHLGEQWLEDHKKNIDDDHPYISWHGFQYGIPRQFRKILVKEGKLSEGSMISLAYAQLDEYRKLCDSCDSKHISLSEFFHGRFKNALEKQRRKNSRRDKTGDI